VGKKKIIVIGSGIAGLSAAACLAKEGYDVTILEKNNSPGGRARKFESDGFRFDMGPSWYWMPDVFEKWFQKFGRKISDYYQLKRLDPSYRLFYGSQDFLDVPAGINPLCDFFERLEPGSSIALKNFLHESAYKYRLGIGSMVYKPGLSLREFADKKLLGSLLKLHVFQSLSRYVAKFFKHPRLVGLLEFPVLFLGAAPEKIPALYSLMNYADMALGTWYPMGGMHRIIEAMVEIAREQAVKFMYDTPVTRIDIHRAKAMGAWSDGKFFPADYIVAGADYRHVEKDLLPEKARRYSDAYWESRTMAPSCLIFYLGLNKRIPNLLHHTLFFDEDIKKHIDEIYSDPRWPTAPQFYVCCPSKTDATVAPEGCENIFILIPVAPALKDDEAIREKYFDIAMDRVRKLTGEDLRPLIIFKRSYAHNDFTRDYNAFRGNAYGLANTLMQTANLKPGIESKLIKNLFYTGQLTVPGPGVPPSLISGQVTAETLVRKDRILSKHTPLSQKSGLNHHLRVPDNQ
jgi:phytoene desaturase